MFQGLCIQYIKHLGQLFNIRSMEMDYQNFWDIQGSLMKLSKLYSSQNCSTNTLEIFWIFVLKLPKTPWRIEFDFPYNTV